jgi:hypothetical protein
VNENNHVIPGRYDPQSQTKTEANDQVSSIYPGYFDPTQVPMTPGDTQVPMQPFQAPITQEKLVEHVERRQCLPQASPEHYRQQMQQEYENLKHPGTQLYKAQSVEAIIIPIVIELSINLNITQKHG